ncbi:hypothetical protein G9A89_004642 [Geosiphon pyriformis]|nr:hypothetical protein G9A89_004642 [Geosiphon pyriformis]
MAESEIIGPNHLGFAKFLFQQYSQQLGLTNNHYPAESAFNFYVNERITDFLGRPDKGKGKLQTPAVTPKGIQIPNWKKQKIESPIYPLYHHMPRSTINIASADMSTSTKTPLARIPDFGTVSPWEITESEEEKNKDQKFNYQNPILEDWNIQTQNQNPELIHQQNLPPVIIINQLPIELIGEPIQPPSPLQPPNLDLMTYAPITKLDNFTGEEDDAQVWLNDIEKAIAANGWNDTQSLINKPQDFDAFKVEFLRYFSNNNSINRLVNTFTTMKQEETEAVTTYLGRFYQNLRQIQAIDANYFTALQILNQFIRGLYSSILQHVHPLHLGTLQDAVTRARDFESTESEANHA